MRLLAVTFVILVQYGFLFGQDGSDMNYVKTAELNKDYLGRKLHLDFYRRSKAFIGNTDKDKQALDTVIIDIDSKKIKFIEHRQDDGYNNWFSEQYLESVEEIEGLKLRVTEFELLKIKEKDILVKGFFVFFDKKGQILPKKSFTKEISFEKKEIIEFLFLEK